MLELSYHETVHISGGAPNKDSSFVYDLVYILTRAVIQSFKEAEIMQKHLVSGSAKHPGS